MKMLSRSIRSASLLQRALLKTSERSVALPTSSDSSLVTCCDHVSSFHSSSFINSEQKQRHARTDVVAASGVSREEQIRPDRKITIYCVPKTAMQSGSAQTAQGGAPAWRLVAEVERKWANPLQGWTSTADPVETMLRQLTFFSKEEAAAYCDKMGYRYEIEEPVVVNKSIRPKRFQGYGANFDVKRLRGGTPIGGLRSEQQTAGKGK
jgi:hypothetical protein